MKQGDFGVHYSRPLPARSDTKSRSFNDYIMNVPLTEESFTISAYKVHSFIVNFISQNDETESVIKVYETDRYVRKD